MLFFYEPFAFKYLPLNIAVISKEVAHMNVISMIFLRFYIHWGGVWPIWKCSAQGGQKKGDRFPGPGVTGSYALPNLDTENRTQTGPYENSENPRPVNHLPNPGSSF